MKQAHFIKSGIALALALGMVTNVSARPDSNGVNSTEADGNRRPTLNAGFERMDTNDDGVLDLGEFQAAVEPRAAALFDRADQDDDGYVSLVEFESFGAKKRATVEEYGDDIIDCMQELSEENEDIIVPEADDRTTQERFDDLDTNGDGYIDETEALSARLDTAANRFDRADQDEDGLLTEEEYQEAGARVRATKRALRQCFREVSATNDVLETTL